MSPKTKQKKRDRHHQADRERPTDSAGFSNNSSTIALDLATGSELSSNRHDKVKSQKCVRVPLRFTHKLHSLTRAPSAGVGKFVKQGRRFEVGRAKKAREDIWSDNDSEHDDNEKKNRNENVVENKKHSGVIFISEALNSSEANVAAVMTSSPDLMCQEFGRYYATTRSRQLLKQLCQEKLGIPVPVMAWERWQATKKLQEGPNSEDPLLPNFTDKSAKNRKKTQDLDAADEGLVDDLDRVHIPNFSYELMKSSKRIVCEQVVRNFGHLSASETKGAFQRSETKGVYGELKVVQHKFTFDYICNDKLLKLNVAHHKKLQKLWSKYSQNHGKLPKVDQLHIDNFDMAVFILLLRYHSLLGHGMQCALPDEVFTVLKRDLECKFECFASPLNCRRAPFCSAFPDIDRHFGSLGGFFQVFDSSKKKQFLNLFPEGGTFEVNPPFVSSVMVHALDVIEGLLSELESVPLLFTIIFPGWKECAAWTSVSKSKFLLRSPILIAAADHGYVSGAQHQRRERFLAAPFDTGVFIVGNEMAREKFCRNLVDEDYQLEDSLRQAFAQGVPTKAEAHRRRKEGRGFGDLDGGGGVYNGKTKQNRKKNIGSKAVESHKPKKFKVKI